MLSICTASILLSQLLAAPPSARATGPVSTIERSGKGTLITMWLDSAPFPAEESAYTDSTVLVWVPDHYRPLRGPAVDMLVHFHGHTNVAARALRQTRVAEQLEASGRFAILVLPQLALEASDSAAGKLEKRGGLRRLLNDVINALGRRSVRRALARYGPLPRRARPGRVLVSAHSGGFRAAAYAVRDGQVDIHEVYLFDALYGYSHRFARWLKLDPKRRLVTIHRGTGTVARWTEKLRASLQKRSIPYLEESVEGALSSQALSSARVVISQTAVPHARVIFESNALRDCLRGSRLGGLPDRFRRDKREPRTITVDSR